MTSVAEGVVFTMTSHRVPAPHSSHLISTDFAEISLRVGAVGFQ